MTQTDLNTPAAGAAPAVARKRTAKAKAAAAKPAPASAADEAPKPGLTSSQAELQEVQPDSAGQEPLPAAASEENRPALDEVQTQADEPAEPQPLADAVPAAEVRKEAVIAKRDDALLVIVKNAGFQTIFEPLSKTSVGPGETAEIRCSTGQFKRDVLNNLKQFIGLGKKLEIRNA